MWDNIYKISLQEQEGVIDSVPATCVNTARRVTGFQDQWIRGVGEGLQTFLLKGRHRKDDAEEMHFTTLYLLPLEKLLKDPEPGWSIFQIDRKELGLFFLSPSAA